MRPGATEPTLRHERVHAGIFALPALVFLLTVIPVVAVWVVLSAMTHVSQDLNQRAPDLTFLYGFVFALLLLPGIACLLVAWIAYLKSEIVLTNKRLVFRTGFIMRVSGELPLENVEAIFLTEPLLGRLLGFGTIVVTGIGGAQFPLHFVRRPQDFYSALRSAVDATKTHPTPPVVPLLANDDSRYMPR